METGERRWHYQVVRHDIWDADIATPLLLYDITMDGEPVKAVAAMRADGYLFFFNRETGEPLLPIEERPVPQDDQQRTVPTQPFPTRTESILPGVFLLARPRAAAVPAQLQQLYAAVGQRADRRRARRADSAGTGHADGVLTPNRLRLRPGSRACRPRPPVRGSVRLEHRPVPSDPA